MLHGSTQWQALLQLSLEVPQHIPKKVHKSFIIIVNDLCNIYRFAYFARKVHDINIYRFPVKYMDHTTFSRILYLLAILYLRFGNHYIISCPPGTTPSTLGNCVTCPVSYYCPPNRNPQPCPPGYVCPGGSSYPYPSQERIKRSPFVAA
jgi:hypothetical protein